MHAVDKASGCVFVPPPDAKVPEGTIDTSKAPPTERPNAYGLFSSAMGEMRGPRSDPRDVQERWVDSREEYDAWEKAQWRREGLMVQEQVKTSKIRERTTKQTFPAGPANT